MVRTELIRPLIECLKDNAVHFPEKAAFADRRRSVTWAELDQRTGRVAGHMAGLGLQPADRVLLYLNDCVAAVEAHLSVLRLGGISAPIHTGLTDAELAMLLEDSGAEAVFTDVEHLPQVRRLRHDFPHLVVLLVDHDELVETHELPLFSVMAMTEPEFAGDNDLALDDLAFLSYPAGTTGAPRGVLFSQRNVMWAIAACYSPVLGLGPEDRVCSPLPLAEGLAQQVGVIGVVTVGATGWIASASAGDLGDLIAHRVGLLSDLVEQELTFIAGMPNTYQDLVWAAGGRDVDAPALRTCLVGGTRGVAALRETVEEKFGARLITSYMTTETSGPVAVSWPTGEGGNAAAGLPIPGVSIRVIDPMTGTDAGPGQEGEVWVNGPNVTAGGYQNRPKASAAVIKDGWYHTGDLGKRDKLGYLTVTGRLSEVIRRRGDLINPREIEAVLLTAPGVAAAVVVGKPDVAFGEVPIAYLQAGPDGIDTDAIHTACQDLPTARIPVALYRVDSVPVRERAGGPGARCSTCQPT